MLRNDYPSCCGAFLKLFTFAAGWITSCPSGLSLQIWNVDRALSPLLFICGERLKIWYPMWSWTIMKRRFSPWVKHFYVCRCHTGFYSLVRRYRGILSNFFHFCERWYFKHFDFYFKNSVSFICCRLVVCVQLTWFYLRCHRAHFWHQGRFFVAGRGS